MTTASTHGPRTGVSPLLAAVTAGSVAVLVLVLLGAVADGRAAVTGAAAGGVLTLLVFTLGITAVSLVARVLPSASLLVALMTYTLQLLALALVLVAIDRADPDPGTLSRGWFVAAVIVVTLAWTAGQLVSATRQRMVAFEPVDEPSSGARPVAHPGGER